MTGENYLKMNEEETKHIVKKNLLTQKGFR